MKIFISWSGKKGEAVALELRQWISGVIQAVNPWMSQHDIAAGARWNKEISEELEKTKFGIICLTKESCTAPWLLFEAGALAKKLTDTYVCPYLIDLEPNEIPAGPLTQFQAKRANEKETWELISTINKASEKEAISEEQLKKTFDLWWPELKRKLGDLSTETTGEALPRSIDDMVKETLDIVRELRRSRSMKEYPRERIMKILEETFLDEGARQAAKTLGYLKEYEDVLESNRKTARTKDNETEE